MNWQTRHTSLLVIITGFCLFYFLFRATWLLVPAAIAVPGFFHAGYGEFIHRGWMKLAMLLGWINSRILLTVLFFLVLTPVALVARLLGKTSIRKNPDKVTQFVKRNHLYTKTDLQHPW